MTRLKQLLRGVQNIYHQLRGQHLSQEKGGETHFALIQHTVPTEFLGRSYPATAPGGKMAKQASQVCCALHFTHTDTNLPLTSPCTSTESCCNTNLCSWAANCSSGDTWSLPAPYIWQFHLLHFQRQTFKPFSQSSWLPLFWRISTFSIC